MSVDTAEDEICQIEENQCFSERNEERRGSEGNTGIKHMKKTQST
jgi:hypothetical protein